MNIWKLSLVVAGIGAAVLGLAQGPAGAPGGGGRRGGGMMGGGMRGKPGDMFKKMLEPLKLTPAQKKKTDAMIDDMVAARMKERAANKAAGGGKPSPEMVEKRKAERKEFEAKLEKVLTKDQQKKWKAEMDQMKSMRRGGMGGGRPGMPGTGAPAPAKP